MKLVELLRPRTGAIPVVCGDPCTTFEDDTHLEYHLKEDLAKAVAKANEHGATVWMRFAIFEEQIGDTLVDALKARSHGVSRARLKSASQADSTKDLVRNLTRKCRGIYFQDARDISTTVEVGHSRTHTTYVVYEVMVDPGSSLPSAPA